MNEPVYQLAAATKSLVRRPQHLVGRPILAAACLRAGSSTIDKSRVAIEPPCVSMRTDAKAFAALSFNAAMKQLIAAAFASVFLLAAQDAQRPKNTYHSSGGASSTPRIVSPEVRPDRTIVFRLKAPDATRVTLSFAGSKPMSKDDSGVWNATVGPVVPEIYQYNFVVDGVRILDPGNPNLKNGRAIDASVVEVLGNPPRFDELQPVPHGALSIRTYLSTPLKKPRKLYVYTPPQYDLEPTRRFPVLYLRYGSGDNEENWSDTGRAGVILDNLIAQHKAAPMIIVMPNGDTDGSWGGGSSPEGIELLSQELLSDIIPMIDRTYRVAPGRENRAMTGLSMGGGQAFTIGLKHLDLFAWVGEFSSGLVSDTEFRLASSITPTTLTRS
jgi:enterochelin esterase family protein